MAWRRRTTKHFHWNFLNPILTKEGWLFFGAYKKVWENGFLVRITRQMDEQPDIG